MRIYISIGSNIERERNLRSATACLGERFGPLVLSSVFESTPVGFEGENFFNLVAGGDTSLEAREVVRELQAIEARHGRVRHGTQVGARTLDLDLLSYGTLVSHEPGLQLPRKEIEHYAFVLQPLAQIAPHERHPVMGRTYLELWNAFSHPNQSLWPIPFHWQ